MRKMRLFLCIIILTCLGPAASAQTTVVLPEGTPIKLRLLERLDSRYNVVGHPVHLGVAEAVVIEGSILVAAGDSVSGIITEAKRRMLGMPGSLDFVILYVRGVDGQNVRVRSFGTRREGGGLGYLAKNAMVEQGTLFQVYVDREKAIVIQ